MSDKTISAVIDRLKELSLKYEDINHPDKLEAFRSLSGLLKQGDELSDLKKLNSTFLFLTVSLHKTSSKDIVRKLIIKCINTVTNLSGFNKLNEADLVNQTLVDFIINNTADLSNKLFVLTVYLENLEKYGVRAVMLFRDECGEVLSNWCCDLIEGLNDRNAAPIVIFKLSQSLQMLFKTLVVFLQKCFSGRGKTSQYLDRLCFSVAGFLENDDLVNMELGYAASMIYILLLGLGSEGSLEGLLQKTLDVACQECDHRIELRHLCLFQAAFVMLKPCQFLNNNNKLADLFQKILIAILKSRTESTDVCHSIAIARVINFWTIKLNELLNVKDLVLTDFFCSTQTAWLDDLISLVWSHFDHSIDVVRNLSIQNYRLVLQGAKYLKKCDVDELLVKETKKCLEMGLQNNSVLNALVVLLDSGVKSNYLIKLEPRIAFSLVEVIGERSTACTVSDLYSKLFRGHRDDIELRGNTEMSLESCSLMWWTPLVQVLESTNKLKKSYVNEYFLPRLMRLFPDGIIYCQQVAKQASTLISCTRVSRSLNPAANNSNNNCLYGTLNVQVLQEAVKSSNDQVRLDAFCLLCDNPKTTEAVLSVELELVKEFLYFNSENNYPAFRQSTVTSIKKLFNRLKESWIFHMRTSKRSPSCDSGGQLHEMYKQFVDWMFRFLIDSLHLDSTFARRSQSLMVLTLFVDVFITSDVNNNNNNTTTTSGDLKTLFNPVQAFDRRSLLTLMQGLWDTYVNNKNLALELLLKVDTNLFEVHNFDVKKYFNVAIDLLSSRKPIDSMTSVYLMLFIQKKSTLEKLAASTSSNSLSMYLVESIFQEFENHCHAARKNLLLASLKTPIYGSLLAIHELIVRSVDEMKTPKHTADWKKLLDRLINLCFDVSQVVSPIVNSSSPEGIFPAELSVVEADLTESVTPQMLLVCCWRTMKEISLLFGDMVKTLPIEFENGTNETDFVLTSTHLFAIGEYFVKHLFETRHRGAFELAYVGFTSVCETFWKCKSEVYCQQPNKWLDYVLNLIQSDEARNKICETRRGGGIPFYVQAIVSSELADNSNRKSLDRSMSVLLDLASRQFSDDGQNFSKVLAMYILSALFKDTRIGEDVLKYAEQTLMIAIGSFDSVYWNVRNGSSLLFCSLINRIFGTNRSKQQISKKNSMPGKMFFSKFPRMYQFFMQVINDSIKQLETNLNAKLYLVVLILGHLFTLSDAASDPETLLHTYIPLLLNCCKSPVLKTRTFIAKAISAILCLDRYPDLIHQILDHFSVNFYRSTSLNTKQIDNNFVDGILQLLNSLVQKHNILRFISPTEFFTRLFTPNLALKLIHCPINYMNYLRLLTKLFCLNKDQFKDQTCLAELCAVKTKLALESIDSLSIEGSSVPCLQKPGSHDYLCQLGYSLCILLEARFKLNVSERLEDFQVLLERCAGLLDRSVEYSMFFLKGLVEYFKDFIDLNEEIEKELTEDQIKVYSEVDEVLWTLAKTKVYEAFVDAMEIGNRLNVKTACQYLAIHLRLRGAWNEKVEIWKNLVTICATETESEVRVAILDVMSYVFSHITEYSAETPLHLSHLKIDELVKSLETYMDRENESLSLAKFLNRNATFLFTDTTLLIDKRLKFWDILFDMLLNADSEVNRLAASTIASLKKDTNHDYDLIAINKLAVDLFTELNFKFEPLQTVKFLVERYEFISEFDSTSEENDEEFEVCFDKGVESIPSSYYCHLVDIIDVLQGLLVTDQGGSDFNSIYKLICLRLSAELDRCFMILDRMYFNELTSTKIASHLMFGKKLVRFADSTNQAEIRRLVQRVDDHRQLFNSFILKHIDE